MSEYCDTAGGYIHSGTDTHICAQNGSDFGYARNLRRAYANTHLGIYNKSMEG
jgi:hypothetical protein